MKNLTYYKIRYLNNLITTANETMVIVAIAVIVGLVCLMSLLKYKIIYFEIFPYILSLELS